MKRLLLLLLVLTLYLPTASATWSQANQPTGVNCGTSNTCNITVTSTTVGDTGVLIVELDKADNAKTMSSCSGGGTWTTNSGLKATDTNGGGLLACYIVSFSSAVTTVTATISSSTTNAWFLTFRRLHSTGGSVAFESSIGVTTNGATCTACTGTSMTVTGSNDVIVSSMSGGATTASVNSPYGNFDNTNGNGTAINLNTVSGTAATFNQSPTGTRAHLTFGFSEAGGATVSCNSIALLGVGCR